MAQSERGVVLRSGGRRAAAPSLDPDQRRALDTLDSAALVLGPAGSGKSALLAHALAADLVDGVAPSRLLGIAATQSAARRLRAEVVRRCGREAPIVTTLHALALQVVQDDAGHRGAQAPRLLSAADQTAVVADVLLDTGTEPWPGMFHEALRTRAFAERVRDFLGRAGSAGWSPQRLELARQAPAWWPSLAAVWRRYLDVLALSDAMDYRDLLRRAGAVLRRQPGPWQLVAVDDFAELDPLSLRFLRAVRPPDGRLLAAADPDLVVDRFRGAADDGVTGFADLFVGAARPIVLTGSHRFGGPAEDVRTRLAASLPLAGLTASVVRQYRSPRPAGPPTGVDVLTYPDGYAETAGIAGLLRRFVLADAGDGEALRWSRAAVLVRSAERLAGIEQALVGAGIPVQGATAGRWLADEPVVALLATGLGLAAARAGLPVAAPPPQRIGELLTSPMAGADPHDLRQLLRALRRDEVDRAVAAGQAPRGAADLLAAAVADPSLLAAYDSHRFRAVAALDGVQRRLDRSAQIIRDGGDAAAALWPLWSDEPPGPGRWARGLREAALAAGSASAERDLDAALALFAEAQRSPARGGGQQVLDFLSALPGLRWPADRMGPDGAEREAVWLLTAHRSRGRGWPLVVVAGVQEGVWPGDGAGLGLLGEELLAGGVWSGPAAGAAARAAHIADERRLFLLACTRASEHLVITAVAASAHDPAGEQPSRFLADLDLPLRAAGHVRAQRQRPAGIVAELRRGALPELPPVLRRAALIRLRDLSNDPDFPSADPAGWWSVPDRSQGSIPLVPPQAPVSLSVTGLTELAQCPWRWFTTRMLHAGQPSPASAGVGRLVHRVHQGWVDEELPRDLDAAAALVDTVWDALPFDAQWQAQRRRAEVAQALSRLLAWQLDNAERIAFAERSFVADLPLPDGTMVRLRGTADVGIDAGPGQLAILDIKTAKNPPTRAEVQRHVQLAGYQAAVQGGFLGEPREAGGPVATMTAGAGLLMANVADGTRPRVYWQPPLEPAAPEGAWFDELLAVNAARLRSEVFPATPSAACRHCPVAALCPARNPAQRVDP